MQGGWSGSEDESDSDAELSSEDLSESGSSDNSDEEVSETDEEVLLLFGLLFMHT